MSDRVKRVRVQQTFPEGEGRTHTEFAEDSDINRIVGKWRETGFPGNVQLTTPVYADFTSALDYMTAANQLKAANEIFDALPARVRRRVENNPALLIAFVDDPANADELVELGLTKAVVPAPAEEPAAPAVVGGEEIPAGGEVPAGSTS